MLQQITEFQVTKFFTSLGSEDQFITYMKTNGHQQNPQQELSVNTV